MKLERAGRGPRVPSSSGCHLTSLSASAVRSAFNVHRASPSPSRLTAPRGIAIFDNLKRRRGARAEKATQGLNFHIMLTPIAIEDDCDDDRVPLLHNETNGTNRTVPRTRRRNSAKALLRECSAELLGTMIMMLFGLGVCAQKLFSTAPTGLH